MPDEGSDFGELRLANMEAREACLPDSALCPLPPAPSPPEGFRPLPALAFWFCLGISAAIFSIVFLAPRLRTYRALKRQYDGLQTELIAAESHVDYLHKVVDALRDDPQFAAEMARVDFGVAGTEERIPVAAPLSLHGERMTDSMPTQSMAQPFPQSLLGTTFLDPLSDDRSVRGSLLGAASLLVLVAFTLLCDTRANLVNVDPGRWRARCREWFVDRYASERS